MAAIAPADDRELEAFALEALACLLQQRMSAHLRLDHGKAGRSPRGLADPGNAFRLEPRQHCAHGFAGETSALRLREMIADGALNLADRCAEITPVLF